MSSAWYHISLSVFDTDSWARTHSHRLSGRNSALPSTQLLECVWCWKTPICWCPPSATELAASHLVGWRRVVFTRPSSWFSVLLSRLSGISGQSIWESRQMVYLMSKTYTVEKIGINWSESLDYLSVCLKIMCSCLFLYLAVYIGWPAV